MLQSTLLALALVCSVAAAEVTSGRMVYRGPKRRGGLKRRCKAKAKATTVQLPASGNGTYSVGVYPAGGMTDSTPSTNTSNAAPASVGSQQSQQSKSVAAGFGVQDTATAAKNSSTSGDNFLKRNCVHWGWIPADYQKTTTGLQMTPKEINNMVGTPAKFFGAYAHIDARKYKKGQSNTFFDGKEVLNWIDYLKGTGSTAVLSVMPIYGFAGMTDSDNTQAVQLANVIKKFDDAGIPVYLRWGHEMNWYFLPKTDDDNTGSAFYIGTPQDYITGWKVVTNTVRAAVPSVKMFWSPNIGSMDDYAKYYPGKEFVDAVGVDFYPKNDFGNMASHVQNIHDTYAKANGVEFHLGETASTDSDPAKRVAWAQVVTSKDSCKALSNLAGIHWFEYNKEAEFRLTNDPKTGAMFSSMMKSS